MKNFFTNITKDILRTFARNTLIVSRWIIRRLPKPVFKVFSSIFIALGRPLLFKKRKLAMENIRTAFGNEKSEEEMHKISLDCFNTFGKGMVDLIYFVDRPKDIIKNVKIIGRENIDKALSEGNGAILVSAHFGNFILMYLRILLEGYKVNVIMRRTRDTAFEKYISDFRNESGLKTIYDLPARRCVQSSIKALRHNEILIILLDQNFGGDGRVFVDFFGRKAATATGPVVFSNRTKSPILPVFIKSTGHETHEITIESPIELVSTENDEQSTLENIANITKVIENYIRTYPHEWGGWMHKRWKSKTYEEQQFIDSLQNSENITT